MNRISTLGASGYLLFVNLLSFQSTIAQPANTGAKNGSIFTTTGSSSLQFTNPGNVSVSDNNHATVTALLTALSGTSDNVRTSGFNFNIPAGTVINGIQVEIEKSASNISILATITDNSVRLLKAGVATGSNYATSTKWTTTDSYETYGGPNDLWGTTWTTAEVNSSTFGISISTSINGLVTLLPTGRIDHVRVTVYYTHIILPVFIETFTANQGMNNEVFISWKLANREELSGIALQRSTDAAKWSTIYEGLQGKQDSYPDKSNTFTRAYYRLELTTATGHHLYSDVVTVNKGRNELSIYPNPAIDILWIKGVKDGRALRCMDMQGSVHALSFVPDSPSVYQADIRSLHKGLYIISGGERQCLFIKQ